MSSYDLISTMQIDNPQSPSSKRHRWHQLFASGPQVGLSAAKEQLRQSAARELVRVVLQGTLRQPEASPDQLWLSLSDVPWNSDETVPNIYPPTRPALR